MTNILDLLSVFKRDNDSSDSWLIPPLRFTHLKVVVKAGNRFDNNNNNASINDINDVAELLDILPYHCMLRLPLKYVHMFGSLEF